MTTYQLAAKLREMRDAGKADRTVSAMGHLFGIIFGREIAASRSSAAEIARKADVPGDGGISDGRNLAAYVTVKPEIEKRWRCGVGPDPDG